MNIGYFSPTNPFVDKKSWSGTYYSTREALELAGHKVTWIKYVDDSLILKLSRKFYTLFYGKGSFTHSRISSKLKVRTVHDDLEKYDIIFIPGQVDIVAGIKTNTPIIYYTDGTVPLMLDYYWFGFKKRAIKEAKRVEIDAAKNTSMNIYASGWARNSAVKDYKIPKEKTAVLPFGANLTYSDIDNMDLESLIEKRSKHKQINIIFSGVDWKRKGGELVVAACKKLISDGYDVKLTIVGIRDLDSSILNLEFVHNLGFLNKEIDEQYQAYLNAWKNADVLMLPTRAECAGIVFNEASAFGVPVLTTDTGGIPDYVKNNINGYRLPLSASGENYALKLEEWIKEGKLSEFSKNARNLYETDNSWKSWGRKLNKLLQDMI